MCHALSVRSATNTCQWPWMGRRSHCDCCCLYLHGNWRYRWWDWNALRFVSIARTPSKMLISNLPQGLMSGIFPSVNAYSLINPWKAKSSVDRYCQDLKEEIESVVTLHRVSFTDLTQTQKVHHWQNAGRWRRVTWIWWWGGWWLRRTEWQYDLINVSFTILWAVEKSQGFTI